MRVLHDSQSISRELQIFHYKTCQFLYAPGVILIIFFFETVSFKFETAL